jgi:Flp pilus assembly protein TadG
MRRLSRVGPIARLREERGAVAVVVALMMVPLLGCAAIAVDVAAVRAEQQQLQNAADAAALAVAADCAEAACGNTVSTATTLVQANGPGPGGTLGAPTVSVDGTGVTVTARATQRHWFAPVLGIGSSAVSRSSRAQWAGAKTATVLPFAVSLCEYRRQVTAQPLTSLTRSVVTLPSTACTPLTGPVAPAGAWVTTSASSCMLATAIGATLTQYRTSPSATTSNVPPSCRDALADLDGTTVLLPVFDVTGTAAGVPTYTVHGFAAFRVDGFTSPTGGSRWTWLDFIRWVLSYLSGNGNGSGSGNSAPEPPRLTGWFTATAALGDGPLDSSAPDLGVRTVHLADPKA